MLWRKDGAAFDSASLTLLELAARHGGDVLASGRAEMRGLLAREIHHRVKNNLQTVASLLRLAANDDDPKRALRDSIGRVLAIAEVHDLLTETRDGDVDSADLIRRLSRMLRQSLGGEVEASALAPILLAPERATPLALCVSELIANALEHGGGKARVELRRDGAFAELQVSDQGAGPAPDADAIRRGQGLRITEALVHSDLHGVLEFAFDAGVQARVRFPLDE